MQREETPRKTRLSIHDLAFRTIRLRHQHAPHHGHFERDPRFLLRRRGVRSITKRPWSTALYMVRAGAADRGCRRRVHAPGRRRPSRLKRSRNRIGRCGRAPSWSAGICVSVDTRHAEVATRARACRRYHRQRRALDSAIPAMVDVVRSLRLRVLVVMHMKGEPGHHAGRPRRTTTWLLEVRDYLRRCRPLPLEQAGVARARICVDPGPGFGKTPQADASSLCATSTRSCASGLSGHGGGLAQALRGRGLPGGGASRPRRGLGGRSAARLRVGGERRAHPQCGDDGRRAEGLAAVRCCWAWGRTWRWWPSPARRPRRRIAQLNLAVGHLCSLPDTQIVDMSSFYESEPAYYEDQDAFVNAVVLLRSGLPPKELLGYLHSHRELPRPRARH